MKSTFYENPDGKLCEMGDMHGPAGLVTQTSDTTIAYLPSGVLVSTRELSAKEQRQAVESDMRYRAECAAQEDWHL